MRAGEATQVHGFAPVAKVAHIALAIIVAKHIIVNMDRGEETVEVIISLLSHLAKVVGKRNLTIPEGTMKIQVTTRAKKDSFKEFGEKKAGRKGSRR